MRWQDVPPGAGRVEAFDREHGGEAASVFIDGWLVFSDGAQRELNPMGLLQDPPADPQERARRQLVFYRIKAERATAAFEDRKEQVTADLRAAQRSSGRIGAPPPAKDVVQELEKLRDRAREAVAQFRAAKKALEDARPAIAKVREAEDGQRREATSVLLDQLNRIEV